MKIQKRQILKFIPPILDGNEKSEKQRYMLVIDSNEIIFTEKEFKEINRTPIHKF